MLSIYEIFDEYPERRMSRKKHEGKPHPKTKVSHGEGKRFTFHGAFKNKEDAKKKEKEVGGFIREKNGRFYVMKEI